MCRPGYDLLGVVVREKGAAAAHKDDKCAVLSMLFAEHAPASSRCEACQTRLDRSVSQQSRSSSYLLQWSFVSRERDPNKSSLYAPYVLMSHRYKRRSTFDADAGATANFSG